jgi:hypothetical protein
VLISIVHVSSLTFMCCSFLQARAAAFRHKQACYQAAELHKILTRAKARAHADRVGLLACADPVLTLC